MLFLSHNSHSIKSIATMITSVLQVYKNKSTGIILQIHAGMLTLNNRLCSYFGHKWRYRDYSNHIQSNGEKYAFRAARDCTRCKQFSYYYKSWKNADKLEQDYESNYFASASIKIDGVNYK